MKRGTPEHPKVAELCRLLNIGKAEAVGTLELLWHFTSKFAPQGDIGKYSDKAIAEAVAWQRPTGERGVTPECKLSEALVTAKWLDRCPTHRLLVHDWATHADQGVTKFLSRHCLEMYGQCPDKNSLPLPLPVHMPNICSEKTPEAQAPPRKRNKKENLTPDQVTWFAEWYGIYPRHIKRDPAEKAFGKIVTSREICDKAIDAVERRLGGIHGPDPEFYPYPATWINSKPWRDLEDSPMLPLYSGPDPRMIL